MVIMDIETILFLIPFTPLLLLVIFVELVLRWFFNVPKEINKETP